MLRTALARGVDAVRRIPAEDAPSRARSLTPLYAEAVCDCSLKAT